MTTNEIKVTIHSVASLDGMITKKDNSIERLERADYYNPGVGLTKQDTEAFLKTIYCYVMGARTTGTPWNFPLHSAGLMFFKPGEFFR
jgi:hypothetical protein